MNQLLPLSDTQYFFDNRGIVQHKSVELPDIKLLKQGIWLYFILLVFEGALRKWFLPGLATPLLLIRDPVALWLVISCWQKNLLPASNILFGIVLIGFASIFTALFLGHGNLGVAIYGARIMLVHFPLIFVIGRIFTREDVLKIGKAAMFITPFMTVLIILQFYSPQSAWVNRGVGGDMAGAGFSGSGGYFRPPGTFSFTNGTTLFYSLVTPFVFYFILHRKAINKLLFLSASAGLLIAIPFTISRGLFFQVGLTSIFFFFSILRHPKYIVTFLLMAASIIIAILMLKNVDLFKTAIETFFNRFENANEIEGGMEGVFVDRFLGGMVEALVNSQYQPFFGYGLGIGTNAGSALLTGSRGFLIAEEEWGRVIGELGPLMGVGVIFFRVKLCFKIAFASYRKLIKGDFLPWMLLSFGLITMAQGGWSQPTSLGFCVIISGLMLGSFKQP